MFVCLCREREMMMEGIQFYKDRIFEAWRREGRSILWRGRERERWGFLSKFVNTKHM